MTAAVQSDWVQRTLAGMTMEQKVGQLLVSRASVKNIDELVSEGIVGGLYVANDVPAERIKELKSLAPAPLLIAQDLEAGYTADSLKWSAPLSIAAADDRQLAYDWAYMQGQEARSIGVNAVFGPVLDIAMNPDGELCGIRTLGSDPAQVANCGVAVVKGFQDAGLLPFAKHFPGFGRGPQDAHIELSVLEADKETLWDEDLLPFRKAVQEAGLQGVMTGHILVKSVDAETPMPMSAKMMGLLNEIGFDGLAITDSLTMKGILYHYTSEELYPGAIASGHDMLLVDAHTPDRTGHQYLMRAVADGRITLEELDRKVSRILQAKERVCQPDLESYDRAEHERTFSRIAELSMTAQRKDGAPFKPFAAGEKPLFVIVSGDSVEVEGELSSGVNQTAELVRKLKAAFPASEIAAIPLCPNAQQIQSILLKGLRSERVCFIAHTPTKCYTGTNRYMAPLVSLVKGMRSKIHTFVVWGNPYASLDLPLEQFVFAYDRGPWIDPMIEVLLGRLQPSGRLPFRLEG